ncbi:hypothetical protein [Roseicella aerolata]|uniref:Uncharacterized protein n=1 Tax=Roseicella aerolata TaxID=2883479 RepID=A0A9X1IDC0_9PROT|nr:hypothetical protein [Roseicella aerolata]MCB4820985.1 hypothetical protein [Roseicella aerolata]
MGGTRKGGPTQQGPNAAGPGDRHALPPEDAPQPWGTGEKPFHPEGGKPAANPEAEAEKLLARQRTGQAAEGDAGPKAAGKDRA